MKRTLLAALCALAVACGGDDDVDPRDVKFTYGAAQPVAEGSGESGAIWQAEDAFVSALGLPESADPMDVDEAAFSIASLPDGMAGQSMGGGFVVLAASRSPAQPFAKLNALTGRFGPPVRELVSGGAGRLAAELDECITVSESEIRYNHCTTTETYEDDEGEIYTMTLTVDGAFTYRLVGDVLALAWDIDYDTIQSGDGMTFRLEYDLEGAIDIGPSTIDGTATSETEARVSAYGYNVEMSVTHIADFALEYEADPFFCLTGGIIELRRVFTERPSGIPGLDTSDLRDEGVLFTFEGCGIATVAWGTR